MKYACIVGICIFGLVGCHHSSNRTVSARRSLRGAKQQPAYMVTISAIEHGHYTTYQPRPGMVLIRGVGALFECKKAYPWLIAAIDSKDPLLARSVLQYWYVSNTPGSFTRKSLTKWYNVPDSDLVWDGVLWQPKEGYDERKGAPAGVFKGVWRDGGTASAKTESTRPVTTPLPKAFSTP